MRVGEIDEFFIVDVQLADRIGLLLREYHTSIGCSDDSISCFEIRPNQLPLCSSVDHAWNAGDYRLSFTG